MNWLKQMFSRSRRYDEISETIREHMEEKIADLMDNGMTREEAERAARREFGNVTRIEQRSREVWQWPRLERVWADVRYALRGLRKSPGFTAVAVLMLTFGIGATTAIFSVVDGVLLRPLPFPHADRLVTLGDQVSGTNWGKRDHGWVTAPEVLTYQRELHSFSSLGGFGYENLNLSGVGEPAVIHAARMTPSVFAALGVAPMMGRIFTEQEDAQRAQVAVLSYGTWKSQFDGNPNVLGIKILLDRKPYDVIGVMPKDFAFPLTWGPRSHIALWLPMSLLPEELAPEEDANWYLGMVGGLKPGVTVTQAEADADRVAQQIMRSYPPDEASFRIHPVVYPLQQITVLQARPLVRLLFWAVAVILLIACANFAGLLLVRAIRRQRETAVRLALGATARTVLWQTIVESLVLSVAGGVIGVGLATFAIYGGRNLLPDNLPLTNEITLNWMVAGFALLLVVLTGVFCGLAPGFAALRTNVNAQMKEGSRSGSASGAHARLRSGLVVLEIAVTLVLLVASGLLLRSFQKMSGVNLGFEPNHVATAAYSLPQKQYSTQAMVDAFNHGLLERLRQLPGVRDAGLTSTIPAGGGGESITTFVADGYVDPRGPDKTVANPIVLTGDYLRAMGIPLLRGRYLTDADNANSRLVVIVNHEFAEHYWRHQEPIGKRIRLGTAKMSAPWMTVVGELADTKLWSPDQDAHEQFYMPVAQVEKDVGTLPQPNDLNGNGGYIVVRSVLPSDQMENGIRKVVRKLDPQLPLSNVGTMNQVVAQSESPRRFNTIIISSFAFAAVLLAVLGIYSIISFSVASRVQEIAIRMALGSQRSGIVQLVLRSGMMMALVGCLLGLGGAAAASGLLRSFLFGVNPFDPLVMVLAAASVFLLAFAASVIPACRAASVDPIQALRSE
jgi:predicted permease